MPVFATFTFADNIKEPKQANRLYTSFIKRLNYSLTKNKSLTLKYLTVIEFQKRGAVHYHTVFFNLPYYKGDVQKYFREIWSYGFTKINAVNDLQHLSNYVVKYLTKNNRDKRLDGQKYYFSSKGLIQPREFYDKNNILQLLKKLPSNIETIQTQYKTYKGENIIYFRYKLPNSLSIQI